MVCGQDSDYDYGGEAVPHLLVDNSSVCFSVRQLRILKILVPHF